MRRTWLKIFLATLAAIVGASVLYVWAVPLTGPDGRPVVFVGANTIDVGGVIKANVFSFHQLSGDPAPPLPNEWYIYAKSTGIFVRDAGGNITDVLAPSGGGGGGGVGMTAVLVITTNNSLSGEQTFETVTTSTTRVLVVGQTTATQNGFYTTNTSNWPRASDALAGTAFTAGTLVTITSGLGATGNRGSTWMIMSSGTYNTSNFTALKTAAGPAGELVVNKNAASGYLGLTSGGKTPWDRTQEVGTANLTATDQINAATLQRSQIGIQNAGSGNVTLTTGDPRITGCKITDPVTNDGARLLIYGLDPTKTVTIPTGQGVLLAGNTGSVVVGQPTATPPSGGSVEFRCNRTTQTWEQVSYVTLQQARNAGRDMDGAVNEASGLRDGDISAGNYCVRWGNTQKCYCAGVQCLNTTFGPLPIGGSVRVLNNAGTPFFIVNENGTVTGLTAGAAVLIANQGAGQVVCSSGGAPFWLLPVGRTVANSPEEAGARTPRTGSVAKLYVQFATAVPAGHTATFVIQKNYAASGLICSITGGSGVGTGEVGTTTDLQCNDTTHTSAVTAGTDRLGVEVTCSGGTDTFPAFNVAFAIE